MDDAGWDDLRLFLHVATEGGLSGAADRTGLSAPTIGRRMLALERATGRALFIRSQRGYRLAPDGEVLLAHVISMQKTADKIASWRGQAFTLPIVSIGADPWLSGFIATETQAIRGPDDPFRLCCQTHAAGIDFTYRETDIGLVRSRPETGNLAIRKSVQVAHAVYRPAGTDGLPLPWVSIGTQSAHSPADRWVFEHHEADIRTWANAPDLLLRLICAGNGRGLLPFSSVIGGRSSRGTAPSSRNSPIRCGSSPMTTTGIVRKCDWWWTGSPPCSSAMPTASPAVPVERCQGLHAVHSALWCAGFSAAGPSSSCRHSPVSRPSSMRCQRLCRSSVPKRSSAIAALR